MACSRTGSLKGTKGGPPWAEGAAVVHQAPYTARRVSSEGSTSTCSRLSRRFTVSISSWTSALSDARFCLYCVRRHNSAPSASEDRQVSRHFSDGRG